VLRGRRKTHARSHYSIAVQLSSNATRVSKILFFFWTWPYPRARLWIAWCVRAECGVVGRSPPPSRCLFHFSSSYQ
jgi:hypothetical protein